MYLPKDDCTLVSLTDSPLQVNLDVLQSWEESHAKAKYIIILTRADSVMTNTKAILHDNTKSVEKLWKEVRRLYKTSNHQSINNMITRLNSLIFDIKKKNWDMLLSKFMRKEDKSSANSPWIIQADKMVRNITKMYFNDVVDLMNAKIDRQQNVQYSSTSGQYSQST